MITYQEAEQLQEKLSKKIIFEDSFDFRINIIAGCDVEYDKNSNLIAGAIVIFDYKSKKVIEAATHCMEASFPYVPGLFSFREMPPLLEAYKKLNTKPDLIICDGHGAAHPRRFGLACHLGMELDIPTIGCGKTKLYGNYEEPLLERGAMSNLYAEDNNEIIGKVLRTQNGINPLFISVGHKISLNTACKIILEFASKYRLPETTRLADQYAREYLLEFKKNM